MPPPSQELPPAQQSIKRSISPRNSSAPLLPADPQQQYSDGSAAEDGSGADVDPKTGKRRFFGLGKKREEESQSQRSMEVPGAAGMMPQTQAAVSAMQSDLPTKHRPLDLKAHPQPIPISPARHPYPSAIAQSPSRLRSSSPRLHSPASSEIFERNVQEPMPISTLQNELSPAHIPSHVITEDSIPPALEASVEAITSESLGADEVEIVTSSSHQPAAVSVLESSTSHADLTQLHSPSLVHQNSGDMESMQASGFLASGTEEDGASNYGQLDPNDVRRLSFISFADVVQSEHQQQHQQHQAASSFGDIGSRDSLHISNMPSSLGHERAGSPFRSPRSPGSSSGGIITPPPAVNVNSVGEQSPARSGNGLGSPGLQHGELTIETMRQAVRKTASGDLGGHRSAGMSPISDEASLRETRSRTNT